MIGLAMAALVSGWYLQVDNDVLFGTDRWYTSGVRIAHVHRAGDHDVEWGVLQEIYTPEGEAFRPGTVDRAPIGRLLLYGARQETGANCLQTIEVALGVRGRGALGERTTGYIHRVISAPYVDWDREAASRFDAQASVAQSRRFGPITAHAGAVVGGARVFGHAGAQYDWGTPLASPVMRFAPTPPAASGAGTWGAFLGVSARAVARDVLLERSYDPTLPAPTRENLVGRLAAGIGTTHSWGSVSLSAAMDSREFDGQRVPHKFGSLLVHVEF